MFFSAAAYHGKQLKRTLSIARTKDLDGPWQLNSEPILPPDQQIENSALYFEPSNHTWFLFTNHIGLDPGGEYTDSIWVYWSKNLETWDADRRAIVLDRTNCPWSARCIGMPSVVKVEKRLALLYDASTTTHEQQYGQGHRPRLAAASPAAAVVGYSPPEVLMRRAVPGSLTSRCAKEYEQCWERVRSVRAERNAFCQT